MIVASSYVDHPQFEGESFSHFHGYTRAFRKIQTVATHTAPIASFPWHEARHEACLRPWCSTRCAPWSLMITAKWYSPGLIWAAGDGLGEESLAISLFASRGGGCRSHRLSSIEPLEMDEALQDTIERACDRVAHHFHLPLQSGSDPSQNAWAVPTTRRNIWMWWSDSPFASPMPPLEPTSSSGSQVRPLRNSGRLFHSKNAHTLTYLHVFS
jgi:hypothetical protein